MSAETSAQLRARLDAAVAARARLRGRPLRHTIAALAAAAERWRDDASLRADLPRAARLSPAMIAAVVPIAAEALDAATMSALAEREWGAGAARGSGRGTGRRGRCRSAGSTARSCRTR